MELNEKIKRAILNGKKIYVITGAGISKESGIPTFRDEDGLWKKYDPMEFATIEALYNNPAKIWAWHEMLRTELKTKKPNLAHIILAKLEKYFDVIICTQNIDNLHQLAGSTNVIEIHGNANKARCFNCSNRWDLPIEPVIDPKYFKNFDPPKSQLPRCPKCGSLARPDVVFFGEQYGSPLYQAQDLLQGIDLLIIVGTSGEVPTPYFLASKAYYINRMPVIDINPSPTLNDRLNHFPVDLRIYERATVGLKILYDEIVKLKENNT